MGKNELTVKQVHAAKPRSKRYEISAGPPAGLFLLVRTSGQKSWCFRYRFRGRTRNASFPSPFPDMTLAQARAHAESMVETLKKDQDPAEVQIEEKKQEEPNGVKACAEEWIKRYAKKNMRDRSWKESQRLLDKEILPLWKDKYINEIGRPDVLRVLDKLIDRKCPVLANRCLALMKSWFRWSVERGLITMSPTTGIRPPAKEQSRERVLSEGELTEIWRTAPELGYPFGPYFRMLLLTGQRRSEVSNMKWADVDLTSTPALWTLPKESTKAGRIHDVPLPETVAALLESLPRFEKGIYPFSSTSGKRPASGFSKAKARLDKKILERRKKAALAAGSKEVPEGLPGWTLHDFRRSMTTWMEQNGVPIQILSAILNHSPGAIMGITAVYARSKFSKEKREALTRWAEHLESLDDKLELKPTGTDSASRN